MEDRDTIKLLKECDAGSKMAVSSLDDVMDKVENENLKKLLKSNVDVWVRIPIIPDVNDTEEEMKNIKAFFESYGYPAKIELLPYHAMGEHKYEALGKSVEKFDVPDKEKIEKLKNIVVPY